MCRQYSSLLEPKKQLTSDAEVKDESLNKIMKLELIQHKDVNEIKRIWEEYHKTKDVIAATIPVEIYNEINSKARDYPTFLFPIPRTQGYEFIVCQFYKNTVHFTPLLNYQVGNVNSLKNSFLSDLHNNLVLFLGTQGKCTRMSDYNSLHRIQRQ